MADLDYFDSPGDKIVAAPLDFFTDDQTAVVPAPEGPLSQWMSTGGNLVNEGQTAGPVDQAVGSLPTDIKARVAHFARQRFPNDPEAVQRYGMRDGRLFYVGDDGKAYFEESAARLPESASDIPSALAETGKAVAGSTGDVMTMAGGIAGGVTGMTAGAPTGPGAVASGVTGAAIGGGAADMARQALAGALTGEEKPFIDRAMQTGGAMAQEGAGQLLGHGIAKGAGFLGRTPTYSIPEATELGKKAAKFDIPLTAGERTGSRDLIRKQKILASTTEGDEVFENFYRMRNDKVREAVYGLLQKISPETSVRGATRAGVEGAQAAVGVERRALQRQAKPLYDEARAVTDVDTQPVLDLIDSKMADVAPPVAAKLRRIRQALVAAPEKKLAPQEFADSVKAKYNLDKFYVGAGPDNVMRLNLIEVPSAQQGRGIGTSVMNDIISYADDNGMMLALTPEARPTTKGGAAALRKFYKKFGFVDNKGANKDYSISETMLREPSKAGPRVETPTPEGRLARLDEAKKWLDDEISKAGRGDSGIGKAQKFHLEEIRASLLEQADAASPAYAKARGIYTEGLPGATEIEKGVVGDIAKLEANDVLKATRMLFNPRLSSVEDVGLSRRAFEKAGKKAEWNALVRAHLQDAFESIPESAYGDVSNLGGTFFRTVYKNPKSAGMLNEAMKGSPGTSGDIQWFMQVMQATGRAAKGESITAFAQAGQKQLARESKPMASSVVETVEFWKSPSRLGRWWADMAEGKYARKMSELLTTEDGIKKLRELRKLSPTSAGAIVGVSHLLMGSGVAAAKDSVTPDNRDPGFAATQ